MTEVMVAMIGAGGVILASWVQNRRTRRLNTLEHGTSHVERAQAHEATMAAIDIVHTELVGMRDDLRDHINDNEAHGG